MFCALLAASRGGRLEIAEGGRRFALRAARTPSCEARVEVRDPRAYRWTLRGSTGLGEGYVDGPLDQRRPRRADRGSPAATCRPRPLAAAPPSAARAAAARARRWSRATRAPARRKNISAHYDLGNTLFESFLDERMIYSCAYFAEPGRDPRGGPAGEARADLRAARARARRPPARDRHRLGRARDPRRGDARLPGDDDDDLARAARLRASSGCARRASTTGSRCCFATTATSRAATTSSSRSR